MSRYLTLLLILVGRFSLACDAPEIQQKMAAALYQDSDFRQLTCGAIQNCDVKVMAARMDFNTIQIHEIPFSVCSAETTANVKNKLTGIFAIEGAEVRLQMIVFDTDIKPFYKDGRAGLIVDLITDDVGERGEREFFEWNGKNFIHLEYGNIPYLYK
jgi:hypothetical protein